MAAIRDRRLGFAIVPGLLPLIAVGLSLQQRFVLASAVILGILLSDYIGNALRGGTCSKNSPGRREFIKLSNLLSKGGLVTQVYNRLVGLALDKVDIFFGDTGHNDKSLFARWLHLETEGPRWTSIAFDKCLLLGLIYPIAAVYLTWAITGRVGVAEAALGLLNTDPMWKRLLGILIVVPQLVFFLHAAKATGGKRLGFVIAGVFAGILAFPLVKGVCFVAAIAFAAAASGPGAGAVAITFAFAFIVALAEAGAFAASLGGFIGGDIAALLFAFACATGVERLAGVAKRRRRLGAFLCVFTLLTSSACLVAAGLLSGLPTWKLFGPLLIFLCLLTLVNAIFDWIAVGFTRGLMRRGLALGGWWPALFAILDGLVAMGLVWVLASSMVLAIQTFDDIAELSAGPGARILPLIPLLDGLRSAPIHPEYLWVWVLLLSSAIPAILNLLIAPAAFLRALPCINKWVLFRMKKLRRMPAMVAERNRALLTTVLTLQTVFGFALAVFAYSATTYVIPHLVPAIAEIMRDFVANLAIYDAPGHLMAWFRESPQLRL